MSRVKGKLVLFYSSNSIFSNFYPAKFTDVDFMLKLPQSSEFFGEKEYQFSHVEQYMHAYKALIFKDISTLDQILSTSNPKLTKQLGRKVANFDDSVWTKIALDIVTRGIYLKFDQNDEMWQHMRIVGTGRQFVECSKMDRRWGIGRDIKDPKCLDPTQWQGQNWLGLCLDRALKYLNKGTTPNLVIKCIQF